MAKATAECKCATCGNTFYYYKQCRNRGDANDFERWAAAHLTECSECREKRIQAENAAAKAEAVAHDWPELEGTPKQIAWANSIRKWMMDDAYADYQAAELPHDFAAWYDMFLAWVIETHPAAKWWIDHRGLRFSTSKVDVMWHINLRDKFNAENPEAAALFESLDVANRPESLAFFWVWRGRKKTKEVD